jgi:hypothetical protein
VFGVPARGNGRLSYRPKVGKESSAGLGGVCLAVIAMVCAVVASSFSPAVAGGLSFLALAAALVGFYAASSSVLRAW